MSRYKDVPEELAYRLFYPAPVYVISAAFGKDEDAMSAVWVSPLSLKPARVGVLISPERYAYSLIRKSKQFAINKLPFKYTQQMAFIGDVSKRFQRNKMEASGLHLSVGRHSGIKVAKEADAVVECRLETTYEVGDHDLMVGEVLSAYAVREFDVVWNPSSHSYASYLGSVGEGETARRIFVSPTGETEETRWPRTDGVARRTREHKTIEQAGLAFKGQDVHDAAKAVSAKAGVKFEDSLMILDELRRQGALQLRGRLSSSDFE